MNHKIITRNKNTLPVIFCTTGNFLNLKKMKFIPNNKALKSNTNQLTKKNSLSNLSQTFSNEEKSKDEIIKQLKERIKFLENKIKILERENELNKTKRKNSLSKTLILRLNKSNKILQHDKNKVTIPLDKNLLKTKLNKRKKNIFEILDINLIKNNKTNSSLNNTESNLSKNKNHKTNSNMLINHSISNYFTYHNSCTGSALKPKKKSINLKAKRNTTINYINNLLYCINSKTSKSKGKDINHKKNRSYGEGEKKTENGPSGRKINAIPKKGGRKNCNASPKMMMSSTNYSNNISNSFKDEGNIRKCSPKKFSISNSISDKNINFNDIKSKLENIQIRTKNLLGLFSSLNFTKNEISNKFNNINLNNEKIKCVNYNHYIKIKNIEKFKKD